MGNCTNRARWVPLLREAQGGICPYCSEPLPEKGKNKSERSAQWTSGRVATLDHVYPRGREPWRGHQGNLLLVHRRPCNEGKGHAMPTGCQVIWLQAVNLRMGVKLTLKPPKNWQGREASPTGVTVGHQSVTIGASSVGVKVMTRRELAARHPALGQLDDCIGGVADAYRLRRFLGPDL